MIHMEDYIDEYFKIFELSKDEKIDKHKLKKKYHKLCLKYHPDKNKNNDNKKFIEIQNAYKKLLDYAVLQESNTDKPKTNIIEDNIYKFFISLFNKDNLEKIINYVDKIIESKDDLTINYFIELDQMFNKSLFYNEIYDVYIPLWHNYITLSEICNCLNKQCTKEILFVIKLNNIPDNIKIINNNNILIYVDKTNLEKELFSYQVTVNKSIQFSITPQIVRNKYHVCLNEGIPIINNENIYDFSSLSHIIFCFV